GAVAEPPGHLHLLHLLHRRMGVLDEVRVVAVVQVHLVGDLVEHRVAGHDQRLVQRHRPEVGRGPVVERVVGERDQSGAAVGSRGGVSVGEGGGRGGYLPGGPGAVLPLGGPVEYRLAVGGAEKVLELLVGDAAVPDAGVVGRVAGHGEDPAGGGHHHG